MMLARPRVSLRSTLGLLISLLQSSEGFRERLGNRPWNPWAPHGLSTNIMRSRVFAGPGVSVSSIWVSDPGPAAVEWLVLSLVRTICFHLPQPVSEVLREPDVGFAEKNPLRLSRRSKLERLFPRIEQESS